MPTNSTCYLAGEGCKRLKSTPAQVKQAATIVHGLPCTPSGPDRWTRYLIFCRSLWFGYFGLPSNSNPQFVLESRKLVAEAARFFSTAVARWHNWNSHRRAQLTAIVVGPTVLENGFGEHSRHDLHHFCGCQAEKCPDGSTCSVLCRDTSCVAGPPWF